MAYWKDPPHVTRETHELSTGPFSIANCWSLPEGTLKLNCRNAEVLFNHAHRIFLAMDERRYKIRYGRIFEPESNPSVSRGCYMLLLTCSFLSASATKAPAK